jgi:hypothetical protein
MFTSERKSREREGGREGAITDDSANVQQSRAKQSN